MAESAGHKVLRLPPYHCELNPIELVWAQVKGHVAANNKSFKMAQLKELLTTALGEVSSEKWQRCVKHVEENIEPKMWNIDLFTEQAVESLIVSLSEDGRSSSSTESE